MADGENVQVLACARVERAEAKRQLNMLHALRTPAGVNEDNPHDPAPRGLRTHRAGKVSTNTSHRAWTVGL
jgi:hypothetical protein